MTYVYDAIVVGARCAGASTAMLLARRGHRVLLVDRAHFPSEIPHGHFIHRHGPPRLARWGLLDRITATGCPPAIRKTSYLGDFPLAVGDLQVDGIAWGYGPRRAILDKILVDAALESGAELREGLAVESVLSDGDRVTGIRHANGAPITARLTIEADGKHSRIAESVGAHVHDWVSPRRRCCLRERRGHGRRGDELALSSDCLALRTGDVSGLRRSRLRRWTSTSRLASQ